uniref:Tail fiber protein n=1 Tax=Rhizobium phage LG08 TaxID=3129229 RepID=A0AAU8HXZ6_9CAUD
MPVSESHIKPVSSLTAGAGLASSLNLVIERTNDSAKIINANERNIGDMSALKSDDQSSLVNAFNELTSRLEDGDLISVYVGLLKDLNTQNKTNVVAAINEVNNAVGPLSLLEIQNVTNVVSALNYLNDTVGQLANIGDGDFTNIIDALNSKVVKAGDEMTGALKMKNGTVISEIFSGDDAVSSKTKNSFEIKTPGGVGFYPNDVTGSVPAGEASHFFNVDTGDMTARGNIVAEKDFDGKDVIVRGTKVSFVDSSGAQEAAVSKETNGAIRVTAKNGASTALFDFVGNQLKLPSAPTAATSATRKDYVDKQVSDLNTAVDDEYFKKAGGDISGTTKVKNLLTIDTTVEAKTNLSIRQSVSNEIPTLTFTSVDDGSELGSAYYDAASNTVRIKTASNTGAGKLFSFDVDGNIDMINSTGPTKNTHASTKKYVDDRIIFARARANHTGTQLMNTISNAGALATLNKVTVSEIDASGSPSGVTALFGDGAWKTVDLDTSKYIRNNLASYQQVLGQLGVMDTIYLNVSGTVGSFAFSDGASVRGGINFDTSQNLLDIINSGKIIRLDSTGKTVFPGGQELRQDGSAVLKSTSVGGNLTVTGTFSGDGAATFGSSATIKATGTGTITSLLFTNPDGTGRGNLSAHPDKTIQLWADNSSWTFATNGLTYMPGHVVVGSAAGTNGAWVKRDLATNAGVLYNKSSIEINFGDANNFMNVFFSEAGHIYGRKGTDFTGLWSINGNTGAFVTSGDITAMSDRRVKSQIEDVECALEKVSKLRGVTYVKDVDPGVTKYGFIAQEVQEIVPELVIEQDGGFLTVDATHGFEALLVEAVKELKTRIEMLEEENRQLRKSL